MYKKYKTVPVDKFIVGSFRSVCLIYSLCTHTNLCVAIYFKVLEDLNFDGIEVEYMCFRKAY